MIKRAKTSGCAGPAYDADGTLSHACRACGKCDAVAKLIQAAAAQAGTKRSNADRETCGATGGRN